jgi:hypothetical protein
MNRITAFLLFLRLKVLSYFIVSYTFRKEKISRCDLKQTHQMLYLDMLQYLTEHPNVSYADVFAYFADDMHHTNITKYMIKRCFEFLLITGILLGIVMIFVFMPLGDFLLHYTPISYYEVQH